MKKVMTMIVTMICVFALVACGSAKAGGSKDEAILNGKTWKITESSEELPRIFPIMTAQSFMKGEEFELQFLSDGSVLINAAKNGKEYNSTAYYSYSFVDGKLKIQAPLGSTCIVDYELSKKSLKLYDGENYVLFTASCL